MDFQYQIKRLINSCGSIITYEKERLIKVEALDKITYGHFRILDRISESDNATITTLAKKMNMTKPTMTVHIQNMEKLGLIYKEKSTTDKRVSFIRLSELGLKVEMAEQNAFKSMENKIKSKLSAEEQDQLLSLFNKLVD